MSVSDSSRVGVLDYCFTTCIGRVCVYLVAHVLQKVLSDYIREGLSQFSEIFYLAIRRGDDKSFHTSSSTASQQKPGGTDWSTCTLLNLHAHFNCSTGTPWGLAQVFALI